LNVHNVSGVRRIEVHTAEPQVPGLSCLEVEIAIAELKKYKSPGSDQILAELLQAEGEALLYVVHKFINAIWNKEELPEHWKEEYNLRSCYKRYSGHCVVTITGCKGRYQIYCSRCTEKKLRGF
jgi:hypothetical protein